MVRTGHMSLFPFSFLSFLHPLFPLFSGYKSTYRNNDRVLALGDEVAQVLFSRVSPFLEQEVIIDDSNSERHHLGTKGRWRLHHVNPGFRLCRYHPGGHFSPHVDGEYVEGPGSRSLKTLMIYLNGDFQGGATNFINSDHELTWDEGKRRYVALESAIYLRVQPEPGMAIIFDHVILHEGAQVIDGKKYIMRSDAVYELVDRTTTPEEDDFLRQYQRAGELEAAGQGSEAVKIYRLLHRKYPALAEQWRI